MRLSTFALLLVCLLPAAVVAATHGDPGTQPDRRIAITIDDLPWQRIASTPEGALPVRHAQLVAQLKQADAPVVGFVNEGKLEVDGHLQPARLAMLRDWLDAGYELGNHTYGHIDVHAVGVPAYEADILRGERQLRPLLARYGKQPRWFRHPYLRAGRNQVDKAAIVGFLAQHGYVPYMLAKVDYFERQSQQLLGHALPQVWLMHANALNAVAYADLIAGVRRRGYRTITLDEAMADPAYKRPDGYTGRYGPSWLHRWSMVEKWPKDFYAGEPVVPQWVLDLADVESE